MRKPVQLLQNFFSAIREDPRIGTNHISLYMALYELWSWQAFRSPLRVFSRELMPLCKIQGLATYHKSIRELHAYGYILYTPSFDPAKGSCIILCTMNSDMHAQWVKS